MARKIIKSSMVTREQYDGKSASLAQKSAEVKALRRENDRLRNWATGLAEGWHRRTITGTSRFEWLESLRL